LVTIGPMKQLALQIKTFAKSLGFDTVGITDTCMDHYISTFQAWLDHHYFGNMDYMKNHFEKRQHPEKLFSETKTIISVVMHYQADKTDNGIDPYATQKDYHNVVHKKLLQLAKYISTLNKDFKYRAVVDSAPLLEKAIAQKAGLGWIGKNGLLITKNFGSFVFLGELLTNLDLPKDKPCSSGCADCQQCLNVCPTKAIVKPGLIDAKKCISYLTIEHKGIAPKTLRHKMGVHVFGCNLCQQTCPFNQSLKIKNDSCFEKNLELKNSSLLKLFFWDKKTFLEKTLGTPIRRIGYEQWQRNLIIALGNSDSSEEIIIALKNKRKITSKILKKHIDWVLLEIGAKC